MPVENAPEVAEVARLVIALAVLPFLVRTASALRMTGLSRPWFTVTIASIYVSYVLTIVESFAAPEFFNAAQHLCYGIAGVFAVLTALETRRQVMAEHRR